MITATQQLELEIDRDLDNPPEPAPDALKELVRVAEMLRTLIAHKDDIAAQLKEAERMVFKVQNEQLPAMFDALGLKQITLSDGSQLQRSEEIYASCAKERQPVLAEWCESNGYPSIVKGAFNIPIKKGDRETAALVQSALMKLHVGYSFDRTVHPSTLRAMVKERIREALAIPEMISYHIQPTCGWHNTRKETGDGK